MNTLHLAILELLSNYSYPIRILGGVESASSFFILKLLKLERISGSGLALPHLGLFDSRECPADRRIMQTQMLRDLP